MPPPRTTRSRKLLHRLAPYDRILLIAHDNPDPDAIASGWGVQVLVDRALGKPVRFVAGGGIVRAENLEFVRLLEPPVELVDEVVPEAGTALVFVDCLPASRNHLLADVPFRDTAVIDHHQGNASRRRMLFRDLRPGAAACASIVAQYLRQEDVHPDERLATALLYAIRTETSGAGFDHARIDRSAINWLTPIADPDALARIASAPLSRRYFGDLALALQNAFIYENDTGLCILPRAEGAEIVGEVADLLIRCAGVRRVLCAASIGDDILVSVRVRDESESAAILVRKALHGLGRGGGHRHRAGGRIRLGGPMSGMVEGELRAKWLEACGVRGAHPVRLVPEQ
jgi:nanoRNase/pAp phosphatase (c-di-AMP/oligoRNAs hydrolase)